MPEDILSASADSKTVEQISVIVFFTAFIDLVLEKAAYHALVQRLAEPPRPCEQRDLRITLDQLSDHESLIDKVAVFFYDFFEILHTYGYLFPVITHVGSSFLRDDSRSCTASCSLVRLYLIQSQ